MLVGCAILGSLPIRIRKFPMGTWARNGRWIGGAILVWHGGEPSTLPAAGPSALFAFPPRPPTLGALEPWRSCRGARAPVGTPSRWGPEHLLGVRGVLLVAARGPGRGIFVVARAGPQTRGYQNRTRETAGIIFLAPGSGARTSTTRNTAGRSWTGCRRRAR